MILRTVARWFPLAVLAVTVSACTDGGNDSVTIYSGRNEDLMAQVLEDFTAETGIEVQVQYNESDVLARLIAEEGEQSPADLFLSQSPGAVGFLDQAGLLAELPDGVLGQVPEGLRDDDGRWIGVSGRQRVMVYNPDLVDESELPESVLDLTNPAWTGRLAVAPANGSFQDFVTAMRFQLGEDETAAWLSSINANDAQTYAKNSAIVEAVGRGEVDAGLVNHYYNFRAQAENPDHPALNHQFATDDVGSVLIVTAASKLASSQNESADALLEWLLSESAQRYFADETFEYPLASGVEPSDVIPAATFGDVGGIDLEELEGGLTATRELIIEAGFEG